jgi:Asp/Glu/hydantoin racemase
MKAGMHILLINPNTSQQTTALMLRQAIAWMIASKRQSKRGRLSDV